MGGNNRQNVAMLASELLNFCQSELLSEEGIHGIFQRHGLKPKTHDVSNYLFFHAACDNEKVTEGIIQCLLDYFPDAASGAIEDGMTPLYIACQNKNVTKGIVARLIDAAPDSVRSVEEDGWTPLHILCDNKHVDEAVATQIMKLLIEKYPEVVQRAENDGYLPIFYAGMSKSPEFCRVLLDAYPGSERMLHANGALPLHYACIKGSLATVEFLYRQYPAAILHAAALAGHTIGYPIHAAITGVIQRDDPAAAFEILQFLLDCDPDQKLIHFQGMSLLHFACALDDDSTINAVIDMIKMLFDAHPEAIEDDEVTSDVHRYHEQVQAFINSELVYARQAEDRRLMTTPDGNGRLPLHIALQNNVRLGSIKLLVKGNPSAIRNFDQSGLIPLHIACRHHDSASVVEYLVELDTTTLGTVDRDGNTALHHACCGAKYDIIAMLLEDYDAISVSRQNYQQKLPIELLWESNDVDRDGLEYVESIFRLLKAYPETVTMKMTKEQANAGGSSQSGKKRKFGE